MFSFYLATKAGFVIFFRVFRDSVLFQSTVAFTVAYKDLFKSELDCKRGGGGGGDEKEMSQGERKAGEI